MYNDFISYCNILLPISCKQIYVYSNVIGKTDQYLLMARIRTPLTTLEITTLFGTALKGSAIKIVQRSHAGNMFTRARKVSGKNVHVNSLWRASMGRRMKGVVKMHRDCMCTNRFSGLLSCVCTCLLMLCKQVDGISIPDDIICCFFISQALHLVLYNGNLLQKLFSLAQTNDLINKAFYLEFKQKLLFIKVVFEVN